MKKIKVIPVVTAIILLILVLFAWYYSGYSVKENFFSKEKSELNSDSGDGLLYAVEGIKVTFVEFGSDYCMPCRMMRPVMEQVKKRYEGQVKVTFQDIMTTGGKAEAMKFGIRVIPTQVFFDLNNKEYFRHEGFLSFEDIGKVLSRQGVN